MQSPEPFLSKLQKQAGRQKHHRGEVRNPGLGGKPETPVSGQTPLIGLLEAQPLWDSAEVLGRQVTFRSGLLGLLALLGLCQLV